jgi:hypothetical protein
MQPPAFASIGSRTSWVPFLCLLVLLGGGPLRGTAGEFSLAFDGVNDYLRVESTPTFPPAENSSITIEAWIRLASYNPSGSIFVAWGDEGTLQVHFLSIQPGGRIGFTHWGADFVYDAKVNVGEWHHLAAVHDGDQNQDRVYLDGALVGTSSMDPLRVTRTKLILGKHANYDAYFFEGLMDEVRIWNIARSEEQIRQTLWDNLSQPVPGLMARWGFDEGTGTVATDSGPSQLVANLQNQTAWSPLAAPLGPALQIRSASPDGIALSWPAKWTGYQLESVPMLSQPNEWQAVTNSVELSQDLYQVKLPTDTQTRFFRLHRP